MPRRLRSFLVCCAAALLAAASTIAPARGEAIEAERLLQHFDDLVLHRAGDDTKSGQVRKWSGPIRVRLAGTQTGFYGPDALAALRRIAKIAGVPIEEMAEDAKDANYVMEFLDTAFLIVEGRTVSCVARTRSDNAGRIVSVHLQLNYRNPLAMQRCVDHEIGHSFGFGHSHVADSVMSYASGRMVMTPLDRLILRALYDKRLRPGTWRLPALAQATPILTELAGRAPGPAGHIDNVARRMVADAEAGDMWTQNQLGLAFETGQGRAKSHEEALRWYRRSADAGSTVGLFKLGWFTAKGFGVPADHAAAVEWYRKAAMRGHITAQHNLGVHLRDGNGIAADPVEAMMWLELAAKSRHPFTIRSRDLLAAKLAPDALAEARRRAESWKPGS